MEDDGTLSCAYHGWRFAGDGACTAIPQVGTAHVPRARFIPGVRLGFNNLGSIGYLSMDSRPSESIVMIPTFEFYCM